MAQWDDGNSAYRYSLKLPPQWKGIDFALEPAAMKTVQPPDPLADGADSDRPGCHIYLDVGICKAAKPAEASWRPGYEPLPRPPLGPIPERFKAGAAKVENAMPGCGQCCAIVSLGYSGLCWECGLNAEALTAAKTAKNCGETFHQMEINRDLNAWRKSLDARTYDNSVAGIGVVPGIWRKHAAK